MAEAISFQPEQGMLTEVLTILHNSQSTDKKVIIDSRNHLRKLNVYPEFNLYLCYILVFDQHAGPTARSVAGLLLKNNLQWSPKTFTAPVLHYIMANLFEALRDPTVLIRNVTANLISTLLGSLGLDAWPDAMPNLIELLQEDDETVSLGTWLTLADICEDLAPDMCGYRQGFLVHQLMATAIRYFDHSNVEIRSHAINAAVQFIPSGSPGFLDHLEAFVQGVFKLASDDSPAVRQHVCSAVTGLIETKLEQSLPYLLPEFEEIFKFMLACTQSDDEHVALQACEFWLAIVEQEAVRQYLRPMMEQLLPVLLERAQLSDMELIDLKVDVDEDANVPDLDQDVRPILPKDNQHGQGRKHTEDENGPGDHDNGGSDDSDDDDDDDDLYGSDDSDWTIRKCAAMAIDELAVNFGDDILPLLVPLLQQMLSTADWLLQEAAILAIGAVATGCEGMEEHLPDVIPLLLEYVKHPMFPVRMTTCWTLGRYARSIANGPDLFMPVFERVAGRVLDGNKRTQKAACMAVARLIEYEGDRLLDNAETLLPIFAQALELYQRNNYAMLCDVTGSVMECIAPAVVSSELLQPLMDVILKRWQGLPNDDRELFAVHDILSSICISVKDAFLPYAQPVFERALGILHENVAAEVALASGQGTEMPEKEFTISMLDLISGLIEGLQEQIEPLVRDTSLIELLLHCLQHNRLEVRQSAFAVLGDVSKSLFPMIQPYLDQVYPCLEDAIASNDPAVCNNAIWATGELSFHLGERLAPNVPSLLSPLLIALDSSESETLAENAAMTIGRLGLIAARDIAPNLPAFFKRWCLVLRLVDDSDEKESAFDGICCVVQVNPRGALPNFVLFCDAIDRFRYPSDTLIQRFKSILHGFKHAVGEAWPQIFQDYPHLQQSLSHKFDL
eukprot:TRINITY_DN12095_c3_g1_i3.p1 TRINITY_DN12095_c3_g1~~TRINITY_DN12095_c3_g1_i3.p1  ORF type:complete len:903 (+),score=192.85 TRINITY_DN12095_c3_g1_i3:102-2810(+)